MLIPERESSVLQITQESDQLISIGMKIQAIG